MTVVMDEILLRNIFAEVFDLDPESVADDMAPETVDAWDSFGHMRLITAVESGLNVRLSMDEIVAVDSYAALCRVVVSASDR